MHPSAIELAKKHIFISYSSNDEVFARSLYEKLQAAGYPLWIDQKGIVGGDRWRYVLKEALEQTNVVLLLLSPSSEASPWVARERGFAEDQNIPILPLLIEGEIWWDLKDLQVIDLREEAEKEKKGEMWSLPESLVKALKKALNSHTSPEIEEGALAEPEKPQSDWTLEKIIMVIGAIVGTISVIIAALVFLFGDGILVEQPSPTPDDEPTSTVETLAPKDLTPTFVVAATNAPVASATQAPTSTLPNDGIEAAIEAWILNNEYRRDDLLQQMAAQQISYLSRQSLSDLMTLNWCEVEDGRSISDALADDGYAGSVYVIVLQQEETFDFARDVAPRLPDGWQIDSIGYAHQQTVGGYYLVLLLGNASGASPSECVSQ